jgi:catechol 2,3-dioxygenase-like lactoylglutathione lyase family enzyme
MSVTLTANYRDILTPETLTEIDRLVDESFALEDILEFIDRYDESDFRNYYEAYVEAGEEHGYEPVDFFIEEIGDLDEIEDFEDAYLGQFSSPEEMAECHCDDETNHLCFIVPDWAATAEVLLSHNVDRHGDHYFRCSY